MIFSSKVISSFCCCFFLYDEYDIIVPLITALPVSHKSDGEISGESFISRKSAHSFFIIEIKSGSSNRDVLKRHLVGDLTCSWMVNERETGAWSLIVIG